MKLILNKRKKSGSVKTLRREGLLPACVYGPKRKSTNVQLSLDEFRRSLEKYGYSKLIDIEIEGDKKTGKALIREVQRDPVTDEIVHASFYELDLSKPITTDIPVVTKGESKAVKDSIGFLVTPFDSLEVRCLPKDLPENLEVNISGLNEIGDSVSVPDIKIPNGVELTAEEIERMTLAYIAPPQKEIVVEEKPVIDELGVEEEEGEEGEEVAEEGEEGEVPASEGEEKQEEQAPQTEKQ